MKGQTIATDIHVTFEYLRGTIIPRLKRHRGLENYRNGAGYFFPKKKGDVAHTS